MDLTLNITIKDVELNTDKKVTALVNALTALTEALITLAPIDQLPETDENGYKIIPDEIIPDEIRQPSPDDQIAKAIEESEKRREARTKKTEKKAEKDAPTVTETEVRMALGKLQRTDGGKDKVRAILNELGAKNFPELDPAKYAEALALTVKELKAIEEEASE